MYVKLQTSKELNNNHIEMKLCSSMYKNLYPIYNFNLLCGLTFLFQNINEIQSICECFITGIASELSYVSVMPFVAQIHYYKNYLVMQIYHHMYVGHCLADNHCHKCSSNFQHYSHNIDHIQKSLQNIHQYLSQ